MTPNRESTRLYLNPIEASETAMAVKEGNTELLDKVNRFISQMEASGLNDRLRSDWDVRDCKRNCLMKI